MAAAVRRLWNLSKDERAREYLRAEEKRKRDIAAEMKYNWEEGIKKGEKQGMEKGKEEGREMQGQNPL